MADKRVDGVDFTAQHQALANQGAIQETDLPELSYRQSMKAIGSFILLFTV